MSQSNVFNSLRLRDNLHRAITKNCRSELSADGTRIFGFRGIAGLKIAAAPQTLRELSGQLYELIPLNGSLSMDLLASHMLQVAIVACHVDLTGLGPFVSPTKTRQLDILKRRITTDFALICALSLADDHGYRIHLKNSQWEVMHSVLNVKDDDSLFRQFRECLSRTRNAAAPGYAAHFAQSTPRVLSAESYANLASLASAENWEDRVVLTLIEEYLSPTLNPSLAYYSNTVSGDDWKNLYEYMSK